MAILPVFKRLLRPGARDLHPACLLSLTAGARAARDRVDDAEGLAHAWTKNYGQASAPRQLTGVEAHADDSIRLFVFEPLDVADQGYLPRASQGKSVRAAMGERIIPGGRI